MKKYIIKKTNKKGKGLFAMKDFKKGEKVLEIDLSKDKSVYFKDIKKHSQKDSEHWDYVGNGRYVVSFHSYSYINHSCDPNLVVKHLTIAKRQFIADRDIKKGEELTTEYGFAVEGFDKKYCWWKKMKCNCGSKNCRMIIYSDFFKLPKKLQIKYYKYLPLSIKRRYGSKFAKIK